MTGHENCCSILNKDGSLCHQTAKWHPVLLCWPDGTVVEKYNGPPAEAKLMIGVCDTHKETVTISDVMSEAGYQKIKAGFEMAHRVVPRRSDIRLDWKAI